MLNGAPRVAQPENDVVEVATVTVDHPQSVRHRPQQASANDRGPRTRELTPAIAADDWSAHALDERLIHRQHIDR